MKTWAAIARSTSSTEPCRRPPFYRSRALNCRQFFLLGEAAAKGAQGAAVAVGWRNSCHVIERDVVAARIARAFQLPIAQEIAMSQGFQFVPRDLENVDLNDVYQLRFWTREFGVSEARLRSAVAAAATRPGAVKKYLGIGDTVSARVVIRAATPD